LAVRDDLKEAQMGKHAIQAEGRAKPLGAYSHGWRAGDFIFVTGTGPLDSDGKVVGDTIEEQTHTTLDNVETVLRGEGASLADVIKVNVHLSDTNLFPRYNAAYKERFSEPYPARTTVGSDLHFMPGVMIEIEAMAYVGE
jgi:2-iminobutanoate/2-iminopropanoate deaminase